MTEPNDKPREQHTDTDAEREPALDAEKIRDLDPSNDDEDIRGGAGPGGGHGLFGPTH